MAFTHLAGKNLHPQDYLQHLSFKDTSGHFSFLTVRVSILVELATTKAVLINMHPNDRLFPLIASVLQTSVAVGGPNTCNLAAGQILAQHTLAMNYLEMASVPQIHLCFVLGLLFFSQCNQN